MTWVLLDRLCHLSRLQGTALVPTALSARMVGLVGTPTLGVSLQTVSALGRTRPTSRRGRCSS